ncbi:hypothetical protein D3C81_669690 [compost metagenome]
MELIPRITIGAVDLSIEGLTLIPASLPDNADTKFACAYKVSTLILLTEAVSNVFLSSPYPITTISSKFVS